MRTLPTKAIYFSLALLAIFIIGTTIISSGKSGKQPILTTDGEILDGPYDSACNRYWVEASQNPRISYQDFIPNIFWNDATVLVEGYQYKMWLSGGDPYDPDSAISIYATTSNNGVDWNLISTNPVLQPSPGEWDSKKVEVPSVIKVGNTYHMYYGATNQSGSQGFAIGHATSTDGINWIKDPNNPIIVSQPDYSKWGFFLASEPGVVYNDVNEKFYLYYASFGFDPVNVNFPVGILLATSEDGSTFAHHLDEFGDRKPVMTLSDYYDPLEYRGYSTPMAFISSDGKFHLFYDVVKNPSGFSQVALSRAVSEDGINFEEIETDIYSTGGGDWKDYAVLAPTVYEWGKNFKLWFTGYTDPYEPASFDGGIGYSVGKCRWW